MPNSSTKKQRHPLHSISLIAIAISLLFAFGACGGAALPFNLVEAESNDADDADGEDADDAEAKADDADGEDADSTAAESDDADDIEAKADDADGEDADSDESSSMLACQDDDHGDDDTTKGEAEDAATVDEEGSSTEESHEGVNEEEVLEIVEAKAANTALGGALANLLSQIVIREDTTDDDATSVEEESDPSAENAAEADSLATEEAEPTDDEANAEASDESDTQIAGEGADASVEESTEEAADESATAEENADTEDGEANAESSDESSEQIADSSEANDSAEEATDVETTDEAAPTEEAATSEDGEDSEADAEASDEPSEQVTASSEADASTEEASDVDTASDEVAAEAQPDLGETLAGLFSLIVIRPDTADEAADAEVAEEVTEEVAAEATGEAATAEEAAPSEDSEGSEADASTEATDEINIGLMTAEASGVVHPLDGLTADEYQRLVDTLTAEGKTGEETRFIYTGLYEPDKDFMLSWNSWDDFPRLAAALVANGDDVSMAVVDVVAGTVVSWETAEGMMIPALADSEMDSEIADNQSTEVTLVIAEDAGYTFDGNAISWQNWSFHHRFDQRSGLVLSEINYLNKGRLRSILYQMQLEAIFDPYADEEVNSPFGIELSSGIDCPDSATYVGALFADSTGQPYAADSMIPLSCRLHL